MKISFKKEIPLIIVALLPFAYLAYVWNSLPEKVPLHYNMEGEADRYGDKAELLLIPFLLPVLIYLILLMVPAIDPKGKIQKMGNKYQQLRFILVSFMSVLALFILFMVSSNSNSYLNLIYALLGFLFVLLGNYFKTLKPNYFIGIRTPWTLENETVWKKTHILGGKLWFVGGLLIVLCSFLISGKAFFVFFISAVLLLVLIPFVYSYLEFKKLEKV
ncbi:SdpI family protein [Poritiphilus flavus]|uniref:DUF1648 domain-containing protein n=1 Tax=Poritiphilus flavus TaxID=2697053 RepID=A0A6L9ED24_9FLAO|nr:SdpI family protein [Poritiphilus flavus]NAS12654.1 DUF1648 domain-containing protein [Poritiphilus flavus]